MQTELHIFHGYTYTHAHTSFNHYLKKLAVGEALPPPKTHPPPRA